MIEEEGKEEISYKALYEEEISYKALYEDLKEKYKKLKEAYKNDWWCKIEPETTEIELRNLREHNRNLARLATNILCDEKEKEEKKDD